MQTALIITGAILGLFLVLVVIARIKMRKAPMVDDHKDIITLTDKNFSAQLKNKIVLVDFWAAWCGPCRMMAPVLNQLAGELDGNAKIGKLNVEEFGSVSQKYKVRGIPTMILFKDGKEVKRFVGVKSKDFLLAQIKKA